MMSTLTAFRCLNAGGQFKHIPRVVGLWLIESTRRFGAKEGWVGREGGAFCLADADTGLLYHVALVGQCHPEKLSKYLSFCQEKARRLALNSSHVSSWQSRNPDLEEWGGAIRSGHTIFSFSGLPELGDEALMLKVAQFAGALPGNPFRLETAADTLDHIAAQSKNQYWSELRDLM